jgi:hypothetical protein
LDRLGIVLVCEGLLWESSEIIVRSLMCHQATWCRHVLLLFRLLILLVLRCKLVAKKILWPRSSMVLTCSDWKIVLLLENWLVGSKNLTLAQAASNPRLREILLRLLLGSAWLEFTNFKIKC